jgi:heme-degrading monooxygenase HmoA
MYARMTMAQAQPERFDEAVTAVQDTFVSAAQQKLGYRGFLLLTERDQQRLVGISLWESEADMQSSGGTSGYYRQQLAEFTDLLVTPATTTTHEVAVREP